MRAFYKLDLSLPRRADFQLLQIEVLTYSGQGSTVPRIPLVEDRTMVIREYAFSAGLAHQDDVYVDHATRRVYDVQDTQEGTPRLAMEMERSWAARWLNVRRNAPNRVLSAGHLLRLTVSSVPHMPVGPYADSDKLVLKGVERGTYSRASGTDIHGTIWSESEIDLDNVDHGCFCGDELICDECAADKEDHAPGDDHAFVPKCEQQQACDNGTCDCGSQECMICDKRIYSGWAGDSVDQFVCADHIVEDNRPDSLFTRVGAIRGEELPPFAWPGGYLITYLTKDNSVICADCASTDFEDDPAIAADVDEGQNCVCGHARSAHSWLQPNSETDEHPYGVLVENGACKPEDTYGADEHCDCEAYFIPICEACSRPLDPADRSK